MTLPSIPQDQDPRTALHKAVSKALHNNQFADGWPEMVDPVVDAVLALATPPRPVDAERVGEWRPTTPEERKLLGEALIASSMLVGEISPAHSPDKAVTREGVSALRMALEEAEQAAEMRDRGTPDQGSACARAIARDIRQIRQTALAALAATPTPPVSPTPDSTGPAEETEEELDERIARMGARENMRLIDSISDLIGLPHNVELELHHVLAALTPSAPIAERPALSDVLAAVEARRTHDPEHDARVTDYAAIEAMSEAAPITALVRDDVPVGWRLVPEEPTEAMIQAFDRAWWAKTQDVSSPTPTECPEDGGGPVGYGWRAALAATPPTPANAAQGDETSQAARDVLAERRRQVEVEGWTPEHDDAHDGGEMAIAAACYATAPPATYTEREWMFADRPKSWPWHSTWWKPTFYRHNLVRAGALIVAEIERLDRRVGAPTPPLSPDSTGPAGAEDEAEESYKIGKRDGYEEGVQAVAWAVGLDGEYRCSPDPDRHVPDPATMIERIAEHFQAAALTPSAPIAAPVLDDGAREVLDRTVYCLDGKGGCAVPLPKLLRGLADNIDGRSIMDNPAGTARCLRGFADFFEERASEARAFLASLPTPASDVPGDAQTQEAGR